MSDPKLYRPLFASRVAGADPGLSHGQKFKVGDHVSWIRKPDVCAEKSSRHKRAVNYKGPHPHVHARRIRSMKSRATKTITSP